MLSLAAPGGLALLLGAVPVLLLYFLRTRFRLRPSGSNFLWSRIAEKADGGRRPRRRSLLLLALQLLAVALAALAASSPVLTVSHNAPSGLAVIVDVSASMAIQDAVPIAARAADAAAAGAAAAGARAPGAARSRLEVAVELAMAELGSLAPDAPVAVFSAAVALVQEGSAGTDRAAAARALRSIGQTEGGFDEAAVAEGLGVWLALRGEEWSVLLVTDGGLDLGGKALAAASGNALRDSIVARGPGEPGVSGLRLEPGAAGKGVLGRYSVWNPGEEYRTLSLALSRDGRALASGKIVAEPGWSRISLAFAGSIVEGGYSLALDDAETWAPGRVARLAVNPPRPARILLVGEGNAYLRAALAHAGISLRGSDRFPPVSEAILWDIIVADRVEAPARFPGDIISFALPPADSPLMPDGDVSGTLRSAGEPEPLARHTDWGESQVEGARAFLPAPGLRVIARVGDKPVIAAWESGGRRRAFFGPDLSRSDAGRSAAFPVLVRNLVSWCVPPVDAQSAWTLRVGETVRRAEPPSFSAGPGSALKLVREGSLVAVTATRAGFSGWERGGERGVIAADPPVAELAAAAGPLVFERGRVPVARIVTERRPLAAWPAAVLALCLAAEWLLWRGRPAGRQNESA